MWFGGGSVHKILFKRSRNRSSIPSSMGKYPRKAFPSKSLLIDFTQIVVIPQLEINGMKRRGKMLEGGNPQILQGIDLVEFCEGFVYVSVVVP